MSFPADWEMSGMMPMAYNNMPHARVIQQQDDQLMNSWETNIEPSLRSANYFTIQDYSQQQPMQRYLVEQEQTLFGVYNPKPYQTQSYRIDNHVQYEAMGSVPFSYQQRISMPSSPSQHSTSICSSDRSPHVENESYHDYHQSQSSFDDCDLSRSMSGASHATPDLVWPANHEAHMSLPTNGHINMSKIQSFPDPEEVIFQEDEGYADASLKDSPSDLDNRNSRLKKVNSHHRHISDEGLGKSVQDAGSPERVIHVKVESKHAVEVKDEEDDDDAEGEPDMDADDLSIPEVDDEEEDTEYNPRASRTSKRSRPTRTSPTSSRNKRNKVTKSQKSSSSSSLQCKSCSARFKDLASLQKHTSQVHARAFICAFGFAGCSSTFASKNEWKRHVNSQHLALHYWRCEVDHCAPSSSPKKGNTAVKSPEFNRKDLFTQHLVRMHSPHAVKSQKKKNPEWDAKVKHWQASCMKVRRLPPSRARCPKSDCGIVFDGSNCWDDRMEHVGRHLEAAAKGGVNVDIAAEVDQGNDADVLDWALRERIIQRDGFGFRLCAACGPEEDAEGEYE